MRLSTEAFQYFCDKTHWKLAQDFVYWGGLSKDRPSGLLEGYEHFRELSQVYDEERAKKGSDFKYHSLIEVALAINTGRIVEKRNYVELMESEVE